MAVTFKELIDWPKGKGALSTGISNSDTTIVLQTGEGADFPDGAAANFYVLIDFEQIEIDSRTSDTLTVAGGGRGANGTSAVAHLAGTSVSVDVMKIHITDIQDAINGIIAGTTPLDAISIGVDDTT